MTSVHEVVDIEENCPQGGKHIVSYVDVLWGGRRQIHREISCSRCGISSARLTDLPPEAKKAMIETHGEWEARLRANSALRTILVVRDLLGLSPDEAHKRVRSGVFVVQGTNAEVLRFVAELVRRGVESTDVSVQRRS